MIYFLYYWIVLLVFTSLIGNLYKVSTKYPSHTTEGKASIIGALIGATLRFVTFLWFLVTVYPVLSYINQ